jgi:hypothetical protein
VTWDADSYCNVQINDNSCAVSCSVKPLPPLIILLLTQFLGLPGVGSTLIDFFFRLKNWLLSQKGFNATLKVLGILSKSMSGIPSTRTTQPLPRRLVPLSHSLTNSPSFNCSDQSNLGTVVSALGLSAKDQTFAPLSN